jgi:hypothetical protein
MWASLLQETLASLEKAQVNPVYDAMKLMAPTGLTLSRRPDPGRAGNRSKEQQEDSVAGWR